MKKDLKTKPMIVSPEETAVALEGSIAAWKKRAAGHHAPVSVADCPLCVAFNPTEHLTRCIGCPVEQASRAYCAGTPCAPYSDMFEDEEDWEYSEIWDEYNLDDFDTLDQALVFFAQEEVNFLKSLRAPTKKESLS